MLRRSRRTISFSVVELRIVFKGVGVGGVLLLRHISFGFVVPCRWSSRWRYVSALPFPLLSSFPFSSSIPLSIFLPLLLPRPNTFPLPLPLLLRNPHRPARRPLSRRKIEVNVSALRLLETALARWSIWLHCLNWFDVSPIFCLRRSVRSVWSVRCAGSRVCRFVVGIIATWFCVWVGSGHVSYVVGSRGEIVRGEGRMQVGL